jgi:hypothetical protein
LQAFNLNGSPFWPNVTELSINGSVQIVDRLIDNHVSTQLSQVSSDQLVDRRNSAKLKSFVSGIFDYESSANLDRSDEIILKKCVKCVSYITFLWSYIRHEIASHLGKTLYQLLILLQTIHS